MRSQKRDSTSQAKSPAPAPKRSKSPSLTTEQPLARQRTGTSVTILEGDENLKPGKSELEGLAPLPSTPSSTAEQKTPSTPTEPEKVPSSPEEGVPEGRLIDINEPEKEPGDGTGEGEKMKNGKKEESVRMASKIQTPKKGSDSIPRGERGGQRAAMKFGEKPSPQRSPSQADGSKPDETEKFEPSHFRRMSAVHFHNNNDLMKARGVGYTPDQAAPKYGPGVTDEAESLYGSCRLLTDFQYSTWTETVVPLRNHNVVQGFNEMILYLIKLAANPDGPMNHEEAFMATSFLANIRNDLGEHPPNVLALLEYIDYKTFDDGMESSQPFIEVIPPCEAAKRY